MVWLVFTLVLVGLLTHAQEASAHASLTRAEPSEGAILTAPPGLFRLTFNEPVMPLVIRLVDPAGRVSSLEDVKGANTQVVITAPHGLGEGTYLLSWRVVSADGHPVGGTVSFSIGRSSSPAPGDVLAVDMSVRGVLWVVKVLLYGGLMLGVGGVMFRAWLQDNPSRGADRHAIFASLGMGLVAALVAVGVQGLDALALPLIALRKPLAWSTGLDTTFGMTAIIAALACCAGLLALTSQAVVQAKIFALAALIGVGAALAASGHASAAPPQAFMRSAVFAHGVCVAMWSGALIPLAASLRQGGVAYAELSRFSRAIPFVIVPLLLTGVVLAAVQVEHLGALTETAYGRVLIAKGATLVALFALAAGNRFVLTRRVSEGSEHARRRLVTMITIECVLVAVILGIVALWRFTPPPRTLIAAEPTFIHLHAERAMVDIVLTPRRAAGAVLSLTITAGDLGKIQGKEVSIALANQAAGIESVRRTAIRVDDGRWRIDDLRIPVGERWTLRVEILVTDFDKIMVEGDVVLPRIP